MEAGIGYQSPKLLNTTQFVVVVVVVFIVYIADKPDIQCVLLASSNVFSRLLQTKYPRIVVITDCSMIVATNGLMNGSIE